MSNKNNAIDAQKYRELKQKTKEYNSSYYLKNKKEILKTLLKKTDCPLCGRQVNYQHIPRHQKSAFCQKHRKKNKKNQKEEESDDESDDESDEESNG